MKVLRNLVLAEFTAKDSWCFPWTPQQLGVQVLAPQDLRGSQSCSRQEVPLLEPMQPARSTSGSHRKTRLVPAGLTPPVIVNVSCVFIFPFIFLFRISTVPESFLSRVQGGIWQYGSEENQTRKSQYSRTKNSFRKQREHLGAKVSVSATGNDRHLRSGWI